MNIHNKSDNNNNLVIIKAETIKVKHTKTINNIEEVKEYELEEKDVEIIQNEEELSKKEEKEITIVPSQKKELTKKEIYQKYVRESEDTWDKCALRCLVFIPICIGYLFLALFDFLTYLFVPLGICLLYTISFLFNSCKNVISSYQVEEEIGFSGAFTSENEIRLHINNEGGAFHLTEILCFSYMSACVKRYFCFIFVLINHILVPILQSWKRAKKCFLKSKIEELYEDRIKQIEDASQYKGYDQAEPQITLINI